MMAKKIPQPTTPPRERAFLVGVELYKEKTFLPLEDSLTELALLSDTSGLEVVGELTQNWTVRMLRHTLVLARWKN